MSKYAFLRSNASLIIIGLLLGLVGGFKIANTQYRGEQGEALKRDIQQATSESPARKPKSAQSSKRPKQIRMTSRRRLRRQLSSFRLNARRRQCRFLEQARQANPNDPRVNAGLGVAHFMMGQFDQAIDALKSVRASRGRTARSCPHFLSARIFRPGRIWTRPSDCSSNSNPEH